MGKNCSYALCISLCTTVVHNTAQNSSDNFLSYPPENHHSSHDIYWRGGGYVTQIGFRHSLKTLKAWKDLMNTGKSFHTKGKE